VCDVTGCDVDASSASAGSVPVSQYSAQAHIYPMTERHGPAFMADAAAPPYVQQIVQHIMAAEPHGPASAAVYQPTAPADAMTYQQMSADQQRAAAAAQSALVVQHEANAAPTHFVLPPPPAMSAAAAYGPPPSQQFVVGQPGPIGMERFSAPPPPPPPGSMPYPAMPCVSGINTANAAVSYWMTLH